MYFKNFLLKKIMLLLVLSMLLMPSGTFNIDRAIAQGGSLPVQPNATQFDEHNSYRPFYPQKLFRVSWEADVDFRGTDINAEWIVRVEQKWNGRWVLTDEYIQRLTCDKRGNVQIQNNVATFNSHGYITCTIPSYRDAVAQLLDLNLPIHCDCLDPWLSADLHANPNRQREYPLISLNKSGNSLAVFEATLQRQGRNRGYIETEMSSWDYPEKSKVFNVRQSQTFWSGLNPKRFIETLSERHDRYPNLWTTFWTSTDLVNYLSGFNLAHTEWLSWIESQVNIQSIADAQTTDMYTEEMTLYIGYNPATNKYFRGRITNIAVDPGCPGLGGRDH